MNIINIILFMFCINKIYNRCHVSSFNSKKIISISPGGYKGFYLLGVVDFIIEHYDVSNYVFSGASAGSWISLVSTYKGDYKEIINKIFNEKFYNTKTKNLIQIQGLMTHNLLCNYKTSDFDFSRLFIGVVQLNKYYPHTHIYTNFVSLEDAINCCIASSHIPYVTGNMINIYDNKITFDGAFSHFPYLNTSKHILHITPSMWGAYDDNKNNKFVSKIKLIYDYTLRFPKNTNNFKQLYFNGYNDCKKNKLMLDAIFI